MKKILIVLLIGLTLAPTAAFAAASTNTHVSSTQQQIASLTTQIKTLQAQLDNLKSEQKPQTRKVREKTCKTALDVSLDTGKINIKRTHRTDVLGATATVTLSSCEEIEKKSITMSASLPMTVRGKKQTRDTTIPLVWENIEKDGGVWKTQVTTRISASTFTPDGGQPRAGDKNLTFRYGSASETAEIELRN